MRIFNKKKSDIPKRRLDDKNLDKEKSNVFKRNRTIIGTTSSHLTATNTKTDFQSPRAHAHSLSIKRRKISFIFLLVILSAIPIWLLINNFTASISVSLSNTDTLKQIDSKTYENVIQNYLDINPMSRLVFFMDELSLTNYASSKLPEVLNVKQGSAIGLGKTNYSITMREPVAGWKINNQQYYVDSRGVPFEKNYFSNPSVQIVDNSGITLKVGTTAIVSNRFLSFVGKVVALSKSYKYTVTQAALPSDTTRELEVKLKEGNYLVKLSIDRPAGEQVEDMVSAVKYFNRHNEHPKYIDVRVGGKAFYKY